MGRQQTRPIANIREPLFIYLNAPQSFTDIAKSTTRSSASGIHLTPVIPTGNRKQQTTSKQSE